MKKFYTTLVTVLAITHFSYAQWSGGSTGPISYSGGNVGIGTTNPITALQLGDFNGSPNQFVIPGTYNFEQIRLGQISNGNSALEFINHNGVLSSYGMRFLVDVDHGSPGLQLQYAQPSTSYSTLNYITGLYMNLSGNVGIGTSSPNSLLTVGSSSTRGTVNVIGSNTDAAAVSLSDSRTSGHQYTFYNGVSATGNLDVYDQTASAYRFQINASGNVGIGTTSPDQKLTVNGTIHSKEVKVDTSIPVPDYVFEPAYKLPQLSELKTYLDANHHLPEIPSAAEIEKNGLNLGEMNIKLLKKVEELTLYLIEKDKQVEDQKKVNMSLQEQITDLVQQLKKSKRPTFSK